LKREVRASRSGADEGVRAPSDELRVWDCGGISGRGCQGEAMPKKKVIRKHSVKANLQVVELTRAGSSLDLESGPQITQIAWK
jgi:hypothetical protein